MTMTQYSKESRIFFLITVGLAGWCLPGGGHFLLKETKRAIIILATIALTFCIGIYIGSIGVIDPVGAWLAYAGQIMTSPFVGWLGHLTAGGGYPAYGRPNEIGQIYTSTAGLLNLLCVINAVYLAHLRLRGSSGE